MKDEEEMEIFESSFYCDGMCGREIELRSPDKNETAEDILKKAGWFFVNADEAYCPVCQVAHPEISRQIGESAWTKSKDS